MLNRNPLYGLTVKLAKPWTPEIFSESYCVARKKQIRRKKTKPQTATVFSLWFLFLLACPGPGCSKVGQRKLIALSTGWWFIQWIALSTFWTTGTWTLLCWSQLTLLQIFQVFTRVCFLSLTLIRVLLWSPHSFSINGVRLWFKAPLKCRSTNFAKKIFTSYKIGIFHVIAE